MYSSKLASIQRLDKAFTKPRKASTPTKEARAAPSPSRPATASAVLHREQPAEPPLVIKDLLGNAAAVAAADLAPCEVRQRAQDQQDADMAEVLLREARLRRRTQGEERLDRDEYEAIFRRGARDIAMRSVAVPQAVRPQRRYLAPIEAAVAPAPVRRDVSPDAPARRCDPMAAPMSRAVWEQQRADARFDLELRAVQALRSVRVGHDLELDQFAALFKTETREAADRMSYQTALAAVQDAEAGDRELLFDTAEHTERRVLARTERAGRQHIQRRADDVAQASARAELELRRRRQEAEEARAAHERSSLETQEAIGRAMSEGVEEGERVILAEFFFPPVVDDLVRREAAQRAALRTAESGAAVNLAVVGRRCANHNTVAALEQATEQGMRARFFRQWAQTAEHRRREHAKTLFRMRRLQHSNELLLLRRGFSAMEALRRQRQQDRQVGALLNDTTLSQMQFRFWVWRSAVSLQKRRSGADVNATFYDSFTPMHCAAQNGHLGTVTLLRDSGAAVNAQTAEADIAQEYHGGTPVLLKLCGGDLTAQNADGATALGVARECGNVDVGRVPGTRPTVPLLVAADQELQGQGRAMSASSEAALVEVLGDVSAEIEGPSGWAAPPEAGVVAVTIRRAEELRVCRDKLSNMLADLGSLGRSVPPEEVAQCRADCCAAAQELLHLLPPMAAAAPGGQHTCVSGIAALRRPPPELLRELTAAAAVAEQARARGLEAVAQAASQKGHGALAAAMQAAHRANDECGEHAEALRTKLCEARCSTVPMGGGDLTAEECGHLRAAADAVLAEEGPWAGAAGLERRAAALASVAEAVAARHSAHRAVKAAARAVAKAEPDVHSSDDEGAAEEAEATLREARAVHDAALPALLTATAAVQEWATSGEGALALQAFPGDAELAAARAALLHAEFRADTVLPQTPAVDMGTEYPNGLHDAPSPYVYYAGRRCGGGVRPVVLRRLRLGTAALVGQARRQLRDAGRIAVGLRACPDAAAGFPGVVVATRWFVATMPGGTTKTPDAWLEFPRAPFGSLAEVLDAVDGVVFTAAGGAGLCMRLARAVAQLHAAGIRHGDLKPDNVVLWDDSESDLVRPGIIDLLDTAVVGATQTLRGVTLEWLPPEASAARADGRKVYATRELDCWQLGRICEAALDATAPLPEQLQSVRAAASALCAREPGDRVAAATAFLTMEAAVAGAAGSHAELQWALPPRLWLCERGAAPGADFVELDAATDPTAIALVACATEVGRVVDAVYRLENLRLWHVYAAELARVAEQAQGAAWPQRLADEAAVTFAPHGAVALSQEPQGGPSTGEALLLHGAPAQSLRSIAEGGFDPSYSGGFNGALFGAATCLTPLWAKAANEYACLRGDGVFVTRAAVGHVADCLATPHTETRLYRRPPDGHHSVVGDNGSPGAVVAMYRPSQMYPEYLVVFGNDHVRAD